jgi:predicted phosphohydrolase
MKLRAYSDLHEDHYAQYASSKGESAFWYPPELPDDKDTILILAGDIWIGTKFIEWAGFSWITKVAARFKQVLIVLGNHDYWPQGDLSILKGADKCNAMLQDRCLFNVHVLDCDIWTLDDTIFVGATLWTDMNKRDPLAMHNMTNFMSFDGKIQYDTGANGTWSRFTSQKWVDLHDKHAKYIEFVVRNNSDKQIVVITHHLPTYAACDPLYAADMSNAYYASELSDMILDNENIKYWFCGHTHNTSDIMIGDCRVINRSVGYAGEHKEQEGLIPHDVIEI